MNTQVSERDNYALVCTDLVRFLAHVLNVRVEFTQLPELLGFFVRSQRVGVNHALVVSLEATNSERIYLYLYTIAWFFLGFAKRPFATFLVPRRGPLGAQVLLTASRRAESVQADVLVSKLLHSIT